MKTSFNTETILKDVATTLTGEKQESEHQAQGVQIYESPDFGQIRVVMCDGEPWFVARDVCAVLETRTNDALGSLDDDERGYDNIVSPSGVQQMGIVSEPGLYSLLLRSRTRKDNPALSEKLRRFKRWVTHDVLPSIRKNGFYGTPPKDAGQLAVDALLANPRALGQMLIDYADTKERLALETARAEELERTKAWIGNRREATAMATASVAVRQNAKLTEANAALSAENADLKDERGRGENFKAVTNISWIKQFFDVAVKGAWSQIGKALSKVTKALGLEPRRVPGEKYDVQAYPLQAIEEFKRQIETDPDFLKKYRIGEA